MHYTIQTIKTIDQLKGIFPEPEANFMNFVLFSTSGVHGSYCTLEEVEAGLKEYPDFDEDSDEDWPDGYRGNQVTILVVHPRIVCLKYGNIKVSLEDMPYLKALRESSWKAVQEIGK